MEGMLEPSDELHCFLLVPYIAMMVFGAVFTVLSHLIVVYPMVFLLTWKLVKSLTAEE